MHNSKAILIFLLLGITLTAASQGKKIKKSVNPVKSDTTHVVGHAHMDMLWGYSETMKMSLDNLRQTVAFMDEFPDYKMIQSQAAIFDFVEKEDPRLFEKVKKYVIEGRLEPGGGMWTESDQNLTSGEGLVRAFLLGQGYFQSRFGKIARVGWLPDDFGHVSQMPQLLKLAGCDYFYFHRCKPYLGNFWWVGPDSSRVLANGNNDYHNVGVFDSELFIDSLRLFYNKQNRMLFPLGQGDHGGGPTRKNINMIYQYDKDPAFPAIKFSTATEFFEKSEKSMKNLPTHRGEMQFIFEGCYTTVADTKEGNRSSENTLFGAEFFNSLRWIQGDKYPSVELYNLWETVTFNQFHDILPGSAINEANKESIARYADALQKAGRLRDRGFLKMADEVSFKKDMGQPIVAFNLQPVKRKALVEANVYSHEVPVSIKSNFWGDFYRSNNIIPVDIGQGNVSTVLVRDGAGITYPAQIIWSKWTPPGYTSRVQFVVDEMPAGGYKTFYADMTRPGTSNETMAVSDNTFETDFYTVKFDMKTGNIISLTDKKNGMELVKKGEQLNRLKVYLEDKRGGAKAWVIYPIVKIEEVTDVESVKVVEKGPVRVCVESIKKWGRSKFIVRTYLYKSYPRITYDVETHWLETGSFTEDSPMLRATFPLAVGQPGLFCQTPFDVVERPADEMVAGKPYVDKMINRSSVDGSRRDHDDGREVPALKWVDVNNGNYGVALLNNSKYGHSYHQGELRLTLLRSAGSPDIYPNLGKFNISYALFPHSGGWENGVWAEGDDFNVPVYAAEPPSLSLPKNYANRPEEDSFFSLTGKGVVLSGIKKAEEGEELIIRIAEMEGNETLTTMTLPFNIKNARRLNIIEQPLQGVNTPNINSRSLSLKVKPHEIVTIGIKK
jgi:alpha-mannosidase